VYLPPPPYCNVKSISSRVPYIDELLLLKRSIIFSTAICIVVKVIYLFFRLARRPEIIESSPAVVYTYIHNTHTLSHIPCTRLVCIPNVTYTFIYYSQYYVPSLYCSNILNIILFLYEVLYIYIYIFFYHYCSLSFCFCVFRQDFTTAHTMVPSRLIIKKSKGRRYIGDVPAYRGVVV